MTAALLTALLGLAAVDCPSPGDWPLSGFDEDRCPQVWRIHGDATVDRGLDVVILPDAFAEDELDDFRCAAGLIVEKLVTMEPFDRFSDSINVFRIDLASSSSGVEFPADCGGKTCSHTPPVWPDKEEDCAGYAARHPHLGGSLGIATLGPERDACLELDLDARACPPTAQECQVLWPEGEGLRRLWRVAACAPAFDVVMVLANSGTWAGGGVADMHPPLSVATLNGIGNWNTRATLLHHEFGHSLGLLDEYPVSKAYSGGDKQTPPFHENRNLIRAEHGAPPTDIPWLDDCTPGEQGTVVAGDCRLVCGECGGCDPIEPADLPEVGLYEGGFYSECGVYRASGTCAMMRPASPMCAACRVFLRGLFDDLGMQEQPPPATPPTDPEAAPPSP